jgi:hypothetical protein
MRKLDKLDLVSKTDIVTMYEEGKSLKEIATKYSCTSPTVATFLRAEGVTLRGKGKRKKEKVMDNGATSSAPTVFAGGCVEPIEEDNSGLNCVVDDFASERFDSEVADEIFEV